MTLKRIYKRICKNKTCGASVVQNVKNKETIHARILIGAILSNLCTYNYANQFNYTFLYLLWLVLASITKKGEIERELGLHLVPELFWWLNCPTQTIGLTSFALDYMFYRCQRFIYNHTKSTVRNTVDYSGQEKLFGKTNQVRTVRALAADRPRHQSEPRTGTLHKRKSTLRTVRQKRKHHPRPGADRPASGADRPVGEEPKNPKVTGSVK